MKISVSLIVSVAVGLYVIQGQLFCFYSLLNFLGLEKQFDPKHVMLDNPMYILISDIYTYILKVFQRS